MFPSTEPDDGIIRATDLGWIGRDNVHHGLNIRRRIGNDLKNLTRRRLLLK